MSRTLEEKKSQVYFHTITTNKLLLYKVVCVIIDRVNYIQLKWVAVFDRVSIFRASPEIKHFGTMGIGMQRRMQTGTK